MVEEEGKDLDYIHRQVRDRKEADPALGHHARRVLHRRHSLEDNPDIAGIPYSNALPVRTDNIDLRPYLVFAVLRMSTFVLESNFR